MTQHELPDQYLTVARVSKAETKVKGSRFLAEVHPAVDESQARGIVHSIEKRDYDATHHCSAWRIAPPEAVVERFDDDGEPSGSAGRPLLNALRSRQLYGAVVVVTRWFGGTKLGVGGLARAYGEAAMAAVGAATLRTIYREVEILVRANYDHVGAVEAILGREAAKLRGVERDYGSALKVRVRILRGDQDRFVSLLREGTGGQASCEVRILRSE